VHPRMDVPHNTCDGPTRHAPAYAETFCDVLGRWWNERRKNVGGSKPRVKTERLRARMEPLSNATPTYSNAGVRGSLGATRALTRPKKIRQERNVCVCV
jgi:hypothetical protein